MLSKLVTGFNPDVGVAVAGRPFTVEGISRKVTSKHFHINEINNSKSWKLNRTPSILANDTLNKQAGKRWLELAEAEHASIASFARNTLQLMAIGAPSYLLTASQEASIDEVKHTQMCFF